MWWVWAAACGPSDGAFVTDYVEQTCTLLLDCYEPSALAFDGIDSFDTCLGVYGPPVEDLRLACTFDRKAARDCLDALPDAACPADGETLEAALPVACDSVFVQCQGSADETGV